MTFGNDTTAAKRALVIAAHPDDEVLGCGATMARLAQQGWAVHVLIVAEGATSRGAQRDRGGATAELSELARAARAANDILGAASLALEAFPDNRMDSVDLLDVVKVVERSIEQHQPSVVLTHHAGDVNIDHRVLHDAVIAACRPLPGSGVRELLFFEVPSSTEWRPPASGPAFHPNVFVDVSAQLELKLKALGAYASEMRPFPHARSIEAVRALAMWRGASAGCAAAEAFILGRSLR